MFGERERVQPASFQVFQLSPQLVAMAVVVSYSATCAGCRCSHNWKVAVQAVYSDKKVAVVNIYFDFVEDVKTVWLEFFIEQFVNDKTIFF